MSAETRAHGILNAIRHPVLLVDGADRIAFANWQAEAFFATGRAHLTQLRFDEVLPFASPLPALVEQARARGAAVNGYRVDAGSPKLGGARLVDAHAAPVAGRDGAIAVLLMERSMADRVDRQLTHRASARSVTGISAMLAHEIKNPLSGIRGAAQLLETATSGEDRALSRLIRDETDRIVALLDRMETFRDDWPAPRRLVNIHAVLDHVKAVARAGFARDIRIGERYDPSLPPVFANRDQLVQVFLNLVKNACEALENRPEGEIVLTTAYRPGIRLSTPGAGNRVALPLECCVVDNGAGVPDDLLAHMFDPFVTARPGGSGLGLALVARIVGDHGGIVECAREAGRTVLRVLMPVAQAGAKAVP